MANQLSLTESSSRRLKLVDIVTKGRGVHVGLYYLTTWGLEELIDLSGTVSQEITPFRDLEEMKHMLQIC